MTNQSNRRRALIAIIVTCLIPLPFVIGAFLVNIECAVRVFKPDFLVFDSVFPKGLYDLYLILSSDLSLVSTFVPLLMLVYPIVQAARILRHLESEPWFAQKLENDPYPQQFAFFFVMLGLTGTLYGMMIGLDVSGVGDLASATPSQDMIRRSLDRLLGGTATALLSSLVGMIGAFLVAKPIPWIFRRAAGIEADESRRTLAETVEKLTEDLRALSQASRVFAEQLKPGMADGLLERIDRQETVVKEATQYLKQMCTLMTASGQSQTESNQKLESLVGIAGATRDQIGQGNIKLDAMEKAQMQNLKYLQCLESMDPAVRALAVAFDNSNKQLTQMYQVHQQTNSLVGRMIDGDAARHQEMMQKIAALAGTVQAQHDRLTGDQDALRNALAAYLQPKGKNT